MTDKYRFETIAEAREWQRTAPTVLGGLYRENVIWLGEIREEAELYQQAHELGISCEELYDRKHGITRYDI